jgi:hypothetical protein
MHGNRQVDSGHVVELANLAADVLYIGVIGALAGQDAETAAIELVGGALPVAQHQTRSGSGTICEL